jgi:hypothetical protein
VPGATVGTVGVPLRADPGAAAIGWGVLSSVPDGLGWPRATRSRR